jgi:hypothetical protein
VTGEEEIARELEKISFPEREQEKDIEINPQQEKPRWLNQRVVKSAISGQNNNSAPGRNGIGWLPLKILAEVDCEGLEEAVWEDIIPMNTFLIIFEDSK